MITSSPGSTAASIAAIIASVAPFEIVTSLPASTSRPHAMDCLRPTASRRGAAPHVVAYWLWPSRSALTAASTMRGSVSKSGNPWAKLIARSGPLSSRFCRVISRMTDSAKLSAFSDSRAAGLVPRIRSLQVDVGAFCEKACARGADADEEPMPRHDRRSGDVLARERLRDLLDRCVFLEGDDVAGHHLFDGDHECSSSLATVPKLALPPLSSSPVRPGGSLPARYAASGRHPVGSSASRRRVQAIRTASPICSSEDRKSVV